MPRLKVLKGVAHNIGQSFTSSMNYAGDNYSMGHILEFARKTGLSTLTIDFMTGQGEPMGLLRDPISLLPEWYTKMFWNMVKSSGSDRSLIQSAALTLNYDLQRTSRAPYIHFPLTPYTCDVSIFDIHGKDYFAHFEGTWYVEAGRLPGKFRHWWNPFRWFRR
jgi:hypothetical protein